MNIEPHIIGVFIMIPKILDHIVLSRPAIPVKLRLPAKANLYLGGYITSRLDFEPVIHAEL